MAEVKHTPGPWAWFGNANTNSIYLATTHSGRQYVMGFKRWGFSGAQPQFQPGDRGLVNASDLLQFEVGDRSIVGVEAAKKDHSVYRMDIRGIDCADARLIAAAPDLLEALKEAREMVVYLKDRGWSEADGSYDDWVHPIDKVIAKAEGRT